MVAVLAGGMVTPQTMAEDMKIGLGRVVITPSTPVWMAGYASRTEPGTGKLHDLWTKAMAIEDASGNLFDAVDFGRATDQSFVRATDGDPNAELVKHKDVSEDSASPGLKTDGTIF